MEERARFVLEHERGLHTMTELCQRYEIARETGYYWLRRFDEGGLPGLADLGRAPRRHPNQTSQEQERAVLELRRAHTQEGWPAASTMGAMVAREGLVVARKKQMPQAIRSDNGAHFASRAVAGLSRLAVWWMKLGHRAGAHRGRTRSNFCPKIVSPSEN